MAYGQGFAGGYSDTLVPTEQADGGGRLWSTYSSRPRPTRPPAKPRRPVAPRVLEGGSSLAWRLQIVGTGTVIGAAEPVEFRMGVKNDFTWPEDEALLEVLLGLRPATQTINIDGREVVVSWWAD